MKVTVTFHPTPKNRRILGELFDGMKKSGVDIAYGEALNEVIVESRHQSTTEKILLVHGYEITKEKNLVGAMDKIANKYNLNEMYSEDEIPRKVTPRSQVDKQSLVDHVRRKARDVHVARSKSRQQHMRDNFEGQIQAFNEVLRYLRKR